MAVKDLPENPSMLLTTAYIAGNVKRQLEMSESLDSPKAGFAAALIVYKKLQMNKQSPKIDEMEIWSSLTYDQILKRVEASK